MSNWQEIRGSRGKIGLLAPVGKPAVLEAVLDAGADAVYLGLKQFNMRRHRSDFNFTAAQLAGAVGIAHGRGRRVHVTMNTLLGETELEAARDALQSVQAIGVDAVIVNDLAMIGLARETGLRASLHASTMMNVHHAEQARVLKALGVSRIIPSRDISLREIGEIGRLADVEMECFAHGDMCVCQSGQCSLSGMVFGKSSNRGECMKPCRWAFELVRMGNGDQTSAIADGHLLAIKDLCLIRSIPDVIQAGICSMKIEGRMRDAGYLRAIVGAYRQAIDAYYADPTAHAVPAKAFDQVHRQQVRHLSTLTLLGGSSQREHFDPSGTREPLFLSDGCLEADIRDQNEVLEGIAAGPKKIASRIELAVTVSTVEAAEAAIEHGADRIYVAAEQIPGARESISFGVLRDLIERIHCTGTKAAVRTFRITTDREWAETRWLLERLADTPVDGVLVHHLGLMRLTRELCPRARVWGDYGLNVLNSRCARELAELGANEVTLTNEAGYDELPQLAAHSPIPLQVQAHGSLVGMVLDHCVIAMHASASCTKGVCRGPCRHASFALRDRFDQVRPVGHVGRVGQVRQTLSPSTAGTRKTPNPVS